MLAAGTNHRDLFLLGAREDAEPLVPGSDGAGVVDLIGSEVTDVAIGDEVVINPSLNWPNPEDVPAVPEILGGPSQGTFAESVVVPAANVEPKPAWLSWPEAAALPLAALTAYRALFTRGRLRDGEHVLIPGIGGGVAGIALRLAKAAGARVTVTSRSADKRGRARELGADAALDNSADWAEELSGAPVDVVLDGVGPAAFDRSLSTLRPGGRAVIFGATTGDSVRLPLRALFFPQVELLGTSMGSTAEFRSMLAFVAEHRVAPVVHSRWELAETADALRELAGGEQFGNIVLTTG